MRDEEPVSLSNICSGAVEEVFQREFNTILQNIADVNTPAEAKRKLTIEFTVQPFEDRSGAQITFHCKSKPVPVAAVKGTVFLSRSGTKIIAIPHDPKQARLFNPGDGAGPTPIKPS